MVNLNSCITETLPSFSCYARKPQTTPTTTTIKSLNRRKSLALGLGSLFLFSGPTGVSLALEKEKNKYWIDELPLPIPSVDNSIANDKTGTRSFLKKGLYMVDIGVKSRKYRIRKYAFDLLAMADLIGPDTLNYVHRYLRHKSTFMYYDFDKVITAAALDDKKPLTDLANTLFDTMEQLEDAVKLRDLSQTQSFYKDTTVILQQVMDRMAQLYYQPEAGFTSKLTL